MVSTLVIPVITVATPYAVNILDGESHVEMCLHTLLTQSQSRERALCTPYAVTSLSAAYAVCKTKGGLGGSPKKRRVNVETSAPRSFLKNRYHHTRTYMYGFLRLCASSMHYLCFIHHLISV